MIPRYIFKILKTAPKVFKDKSIYLFAYTIYMTLSFLNELYLRIEKLVKKPSATPNYFLNQAEEFDSKIIAINQLRKHEVDKEKINWERA